MGCIRIDNPEQSSVKSANFSAVDLGGDGDAEERGSVDELSEEQAKALLDLAFVPLVVVAGAVTEDA